MFYGCIGFNFLALGMTKAEIFLRNLSDRFDK